MFHFYEYITSNNLIDEVPNYVSDKSTIKIGNKIILIGIEGMKQQMIEVKKTYPDLKMVVTYQYCDGNYVISEFVMEGTHKGE